MATDFTFIFFDAVGMKKKFSKFRNDTLKSLPAQLVTDKSYQFSAKFASANLFPNFLSAAHTTFPKYTQPRKKKSIKK